MATPKTNLHANRVAQQVQDNLVGLQRDMVNGAKSWKATAQAQSLPPATLAQQVRDCATEYLRRLAWVSDLRADPIRRDRLVAALARAQIDEQDVIDLYQSLRAVAQALSTTPVSTYQNIVAASNGLLNTVDAPESLWDE